MTKQITMRILLKDFNTKEEIAGLVRIDDGIAVSAFNKRSIAKRLYDGEIRQGNKNVIYDKENNVVIEKFPTLTANEIYLKIKKELERQGGKETQ